MTLKGTVAFGVVALVACGRPDVSEPSVARGTSPLEQGFDRASKDFAVPSELLKAIAYVETRVSQAPGLVSAAGGHGMLSIVERDGWLMASRAQALTGASLSTLERSPRENVYGAAAVLRELADKAQLHPMSLGDWYRAVALYPGFDSASLAADWAADVFTRLEAGFTVQTPDGTVVLAPTASDWRRFAPAASLRRDALNGSDYPAAVDFTASPNKNSGRSSYDYVVIHTMQGSYSGTVGWFAMSSSMVSAHYLVRSSDGQITQMVHDADTAWHVQCYNSHAIGIEHEGWINDPATWYTEAMYSESAKLTRWLVDRYNIPRDRTHIIAHAEVASSCNTNQHTDPGSGWNWTHYMDLVNGTGPTTMTGVLTGVIYTGGDSNNRVAGAVVEVAGQMLTTTSNGLYQFSLPPGPYTVNVTKPGYTSNQVQRTVVANQTLWGSMDIDPSTATGTLQGLVYAYNAANPSDQSMVLSGATVSVSPGGMQAMSAVDGTFFFTLAPGTYSVSVSKAGYANAMQSTMVTAAQASAVNVALTTGGADQVPPTVTLTFPADHAQLELASVDVNGTASDDQGAIASVKLSLNGGVPTDIPVVSGAFDAQVQLDPGPNTIMVTATDAAGNTASATSTAVFNAGVKGFVFAGMDQSARLTGATCELHDGATGGLISTSTTDAQGNYALSATTVPADYKLIVSAQGYVTHVETVTVGPDARQELDVSMVVGSDTGDDTPSLTFNDPMDGAVINTDSVTVYGTVSGFELLSVRINGVTGQTLGSGGFSATVPLVEGDNALVAEVTGIAGQKLSGILHVTRKLITGDGKGPGDIGGGCGGCSAGGGLELLGLVALLAARRRRRSPG